MFYAPKNPDGSFSIVYTISAIENNLALIVASAPALWTLTRRWFPALFADLGLSRGYQGDIPDIKTAAMYDTASGSNSSRSPLSKKRGIRLFGFKSPFKSRDTNSRTNLNAWSGEYVDHIFDGTHGTNLGPEYMRQHGLGNKSATYSYSSRGSRQTAPDYYTTYARS
jgi:hypothetical protein